MTYRTLLSLAVLLLLALTRAAAQTTVKGHHLENTSVGFYGFAFNVPINYEPYDPPKEKKFTVKTYGDYAWRSSLHVGEKAGYTTLERIPFKTNSTGLVVCVVRCVDRIPTIEQKKEYLRYLDLFMGFCVQRSDNEFIRDTRQIGDIYVGRIGRIYEDIAVAATIVLIPPRTVLLIEAAAPKENRDEMIQDLDAAIATLDIGKRPTPAP